MVKITISKHALDRIKERLDLNEKDIKTFVESAWNKGKTIRKFKGDIKEFILKKMGSMTNGKYRIVIYKEILFVFTAQKPKLITAYEIPEELKDGQIRK